VNIPSWPVGVTITNHVVASGSSCYNSTTHNYGANCFDQINIISAADPATYPPITATNSTGVQAPGNCSHTNFGYAYGLQASGLTLAQTAAKFKQGDQLLFLTGSGSQITSVVLTADAAVVGSAVKFTFNATQQQTVSGVSYAGYNLLANDPLDITACNGDTTCAAAVQPGGKLGDTFCGTDWILKLAPILYSVDLTNPANPTLVRQVGINGTKVPLMEQVIGFKVGAAIWNKPDGDPDYNYDAGTYEQTLSTNDQAYNFTLVRAVRISLIGRTTPSTDPNYKFRNAFDNGAYQVQGTAIVVNPRDLSMND
jgi:hypothetical protein